MPKHELIDLLDENGNKIAIIDKAIAHKKGLWHRSVHLWIINDKQEVLVQKRAAKKEFFPSVYDVSVAGHIASGDNSLDTVIREAKEELGLCVNKNKIKFLFTIKEELIYNNIVSREFVDVFLLKQNLNENNFIYQEEEVESAKFMLIKELYKSNNSKNFLPHIEEYKKLKPYLL